MDSSSGTAQRGEVHARADEECELFGKMPAGDDQDLTDPLQGAEQQDELENAGILPFQMPQQLITGAQCINGNVVRPGNTEEEPPSTACSQSAVTSTRRSSIGKRPSGLSDSLQVIIPGRQIPPPPPPPPPPPAPVPHAPAAPSAATNPREWAPLNTRPKAAGGGGPPDGPPNGPGGGTGKEA